MHFALNSSKPLVGPIVLVGQRFADQGHFSYYGGLLALNYGDLDDVINK